MVTAAGDKDRRLTIVLRGQPCHIGGGRENLRHDKWSPRAAPHNVHEAPPGEGGPHRATQLGGDGGRAEADASRE
jgi:hypothetical protein